MKIINKNKAKKFKNGKKCTAIEYPLKYKYINTAVVKITGRYPDEGRLMNMKCKELCCVIKGKGKIIINNRNISLKEGDLISIEPRDKYFWNANLTIVVSSTPAWHPEQQKKIK